MSEVSNGKAHYINHFGQIFDAIIKRITHHDGNHHAELDVDVNGEVTPISDVPYSTSQETHSWNHVISTEHTEPEIPVVPPDQTEVPVQPSEIHAQ